MDTPTIQQAKAAWDADRKFLAVDAPWWIMPTWSKAPMWRKRPYLMGWTDNPLEAT